MQAFLQMVRVVIFSTVSLLLFACVAAEPEQEPDERSALTTQALNKTCTLAAASDAVGSGFACCNGVDNCTVTNNWESAMWHCNNTWFGPALCALDASAAGISLYNVVEGGPSSYRSASCMRLTVPPEDYFTDLDEPCFLSHSLYWPTSLGSRYSSMKGRPSQGWRVFLNRNTASYSWCSLQVEILPSSQCN